MCMRHKIVLMTGGTETLDYFSRQLQKGFELLGYQTFLFNLESEEESAEQLSHFADAENTILVTFNFDGIHYETSLFDSRGDYFWNKRSIPCVNIAVDHPYFYPELFEIHPDIFYEVSIDRYHDNYMAHFYPELKRGPFLPLAGTSLTPDGSYRPIKDRSISLIFTGNYTPPEEFNSAIHRLGPEYASFYQGILDDLLTDPSQPDDLVIERHLRREFPNVSNEELRQLIPNMIFIDLWIRSYFRGETVRQLVDHGIQIHIIGSGWEQLSCRHPENLTSVPGLLSYDCLTALADSKLSLNVMPWFKDGAHDRIFNSMLNGAVCLTDHSLYLDEILTDGKHICFYDLSGIAALPDQIHTLFQKPDLLEHLQKEAFDYAIRNHTWIQRAKDLHEKLLQYL